MKYYLTADVHGFYTEFHKALDEAGDFTVPEAHFGTGSGQRPRRAAAGGTCVQRPEVQAGRAAFS